MKSFLIHQGAYLHGRYYGETLDEALQALKKEQGFDIVNQELQLQGISHFRFTEVQEGLPARAK